MKITTDSRKLKIEFSKRSQCASSKKNRKARFFAWLDLRAWARLLWDAQSREPSIASLSDCPSAVFTMKRRFAGIVELTSVQCREESSRRYSRRVQTIR